MLNGEKKKLRNTATITTSLMRKTMKLSSFFTGFTGVVSPASSAALGGVWVIEASMWGRISLVKGRVSRWTDRQFDTVQELNGPSAGEPPWRNASGEALRVCSNLGKGDLWAIR